MRKTYGVVWSEDSQPLATGRLELASDGLRLEGRADSGPALQEIAYARLGSVRVGRAADERIGGRPALILELDTGLAVRVTGVGQSTVLAEIAEQIAALRSAQPEPA